MDDMGLRELRQDIDEVDHQLIECLAMRFRLSMEVAARKRQTDSPVLQLHRAAAVQDNYVTLGETLGVSRDFMLQLYSIVHAESCRIQTEMLRA